MFTWLALAKLGCPVAFLNHNIRSKSLLHCFSCCDTKVIISAVGKAVINSSREAFRDLLYRLTTLVTVTIKVFVAGQACICRSMDQDVSSRLTLSMWPASVQGTRVTFWALVLGSVLGFHWCFNWAKNLENSHHHNHHRQILMISWADSGSMRNYCWTLIVSMSMHKLWCVLSFCRTWACSERNQTSTWWEGSSCARHDKRVLYVYKFHRQSRICLGCPHISFLSLTDHLQKPCCVYLHFWHNR